MMQVAGLQGGLIMERKLAWLTYIGGSVMLLPPNIPWVIELISHPNYWLLISCNIGSLELGLVWILRCCWAHSLRSCIVGVVLR